MTYTYANAENTSITDGQGKFIPVDDSNKDYQKLIADNVTIEPYVAPPVPPEYISKLTIIDRLIVASKFDAAMAALDASDRQTRERWTAATLIDKQDVEVVALLTAIGADINVIMA